MDKPASSSYDRILTLDLDGHDLGSYRLSGWVCRLQYDNDNRCLVAGSGDRGVYLLSVAGSGRFDKLEIKG